MNIKTVDFHGACLKASERPTEWFPQVAVAGRSNVGKSSLLNWLFQRRVARVAKAPGKTRTLNFFLVNGGLFIVDLPGYGYAKVARHLQDQWGRELGNYLLHEERLAGVVSLIDVRHGPTSLDMELQALLETAGLDRVVVLTKADKVGRSHCRSMQDAVRKKLGLSSRPLVTSVKSGDGRRDVLLAVAGLAERWKAKQQMEKNHGTQEEDRQG
jgi:GTP-binding protein